MPRKLTKNEYIARLFSKYPNIELIGEYDGGEHITEYKCRICGYTFKKKPRDLECTKYGCANCAKKNVAEKQRKTNDQFLYEMSKINRNIKILDTYFNNSTKVSCKCLIDDYEWKATPAHLLMGKGCPKCGGSMKISHDEFILSLKQINPNIEVLSKYVNDSTKIELRCKICGNIWSAAPTHLKQGRGCPVCAKRKKSLKLSKGLEQFTNDMKIINSDIEILGEYKNSKTKIRCRCLKCGKTWYSLPSNLLRGKIGCFCVRSKGEQKIERWLDTKSIAYYKEYRFEDCRNEKPLPFDFYIPSYNLCIEFDGAQHFSPVDFASKGEDFAICQFDLLKRRDNIKTQYCKDRNIDLLRIPYWDIENIDKILEKHIS